MSALKIALLAFIVFPFSAQAKPVIIKAGRRPVLADIYHPGDRVCLAGQLEKRPDDLTHIATDESTSIVYNLKLDFNIGLEQTWDGRTSRSYSTGLTIDLNDRNLISKVETLGLLKPKARSVVCGTIGYPESSVEGLNAAVLLIDQVAPANRE